MDIDVYSIPICDIREKYVKILKLNTNFINLPKKHGYLFIRIYTKKPGESSLTD